MFCTRIWGCEDFTTVVNGDRLFCAEKLPGAFEWCWLDGDDGRESQAEQPVCANGSCEGLEAAPLVRRGSRRDFSKKIVRRDRCHARCAHFRAANAKTPAGWAGVSGLGSLTITYFHTGIRTIIGVESFHGPVRDGKGWDRLAMVIRQRGLSRCFAARPIGKKQ